MKGNAYFFNSQEAGVIVLVIIQALYTALIFER